MLLSGRTSGQNMYHVEEDCWKLFKEKDDFLPVLFTTTNCLVIIIYWIAEQKPFIQYVYIFEGVDELQISVCFNYLVLNELL